MKRSIPAITVFLFFLLVFSLCKLQPSLPQETKTAPPASARQALPASHETLPDSARCNSILSLLIKLENDVYVNLPTKGAASFMELKKVSFDSSSGCFLVAGKGTFNKSLPEGTWDTGRKMAASGDAKRWALYLKAWRDGSTIDFGKKISGEVSYSRILCERADGDTLYQIIQVPMGSVVVK
jgi:hypothetical protein